MTHPMKAEERKRIAAACGWAQHGAMGIWDPEDSAVLWQALVHACAGLIKSKNMHESDRDWKWRKLGEAVAANDVNAIEALLLELLEQKL